MRFCHAAACTLCTFVFLAVSLRLRSRFRSTNSNVSGRIQSFFLGLFLDLGLATFRQRSEWVHTSRLTSVPIRLPSQHRRLSRDSDIIGFRSLKYFEPVLHFTSVVYCSVIGLSLALLRFQKLMQFRLESHSY